MVTAVPVTAASAYPGAMSVHAKSYAQFPGAVPAISWDGVDDTVSVEVVDEPSQPSAAAKPGKRTQERKRVT